MNQRTVGSWAWEDWEEDDGPIGYRNTLTTVVPFQNEFERRLWGQHSPNGRPVPLIGCSECGNETPEDVKALIAAAPDLLAACEAARDKFQTLATVYPYDPDFSEMERILNAAIAKAMGE